ncbi:hypothetical protein BH11PLA1_BH11PLA1_13060 [soil metagenome]
MNVLVSPILLYGACGLGAVGVALSLPRPRLSLFLFGAIVAAVALGALFIGLGVAYPRLIPNAHFYIFSVIALGGALRVITHPRPVYAALYFVLTILASCGLYLLLSAEFLAFALVIVYAGAILITYLFVIMLATEGPTALAAGSMNEYDRVSREPLAATIAGFVLLGGLTTALATGSARLEPNVAMMVGDRPLAVMPRKVEGVLREAEEERTRAAERGDVSAQNTPPYLAAGEKLTMANTRVRDALAAANLLPLDEWTASQPRTRDGGEAYAISAASGRDANGMTGWLVLENEKGDLRVVPRAQWPARLALTNAEGVAFNLIEDHPGSIEIAGVILLMAMLGAVVLARKKVELDDQAKVEAAARVHASARLGTVLGEDAEFVAPMVGAGREASEGPATPVGAGGAGR